MWEVHPSCWNVTAPVCLIKNRLESVTSIFGKVSLLIMTSQKQTPRQSRNLGWSSPPPWAERVGAAQVRLCIKEQKSPTPLWQSAPSARMQKKDAGLYKSISPSNLNHQLIPDPLPQAKKDWNAKRGQECSSKSCSFHMGENIRNEEWISPPCPILSHPFPPTKKIKVL